MSESNEAKKPQRPVLGLHHVTAIAGDPQQNVDFYAGVLGLRLVKKTVNFDDPGTYHLYFGDGDGNPGSIMTFFPWPGARQGHAGRGQTRTTTFAVPQGSLDFWRHRLAIAGVEIEEGESFGEETLSFRDGDGLHLALVANAAADDARRPWSGADIPADVAILGFDAVSLQVTHLEPTEAAPEAMGFRRVGSEGDRHRFEVGDGGSGTRVDVLVTPGAPPARSGAGTVHHVAFRNVDDDSQLEWQQYLGAAGLWPTDVKDRNYFHSIYFREPGGVLFELATDPPGFAIDEEASALGEELKLPAWFESRRDQIENALLPITVPAALPKAGAAS